MNKHKTKGFTLVELIVVIVILAILATIAFLTFSSQSSTARDSRRVTELREVSSALENGMVTLGKFPKPTNSTPMQFNSCTAFTQGTFGKDTFTSAGKISETPTDPLYGVEYTYSTTPAGDQYEIAGVLENDQTAYVNPFIDQAYAMVQASPVNGVCGISNGQSYPQGTDFEAISSNLCLDPGGLPPNMSDPANDFIGTDGTFHWICPGQNGGADSLTCTATNSSYVEPPSTPTVTGVKKTGRAVVMGNYNLIIDKTECSGKTVLLGLPSIISSDTGTDLDTQFDDTYQGKTLVYDKLSNLPSSYISNELVMSGSKIFGATSPGDSIKLWESVDSTDANGARKNPEKKVDYRCIMQKLSTLYNGTSMTTNPVYKQIVDTVALGDNLTTSKKGKEIYCGAFNGCKGDEATDLSVDEVCPNVPQT